MPACVSHTDGPTSSTNKDASGGNGQAKPLGDRSPLHFAAERGSVPMLELLISHGAKVSHYTCTHTHTHRTRVQICTVLGCASHRHR